MIYGEVSSKDKSLKHGKEDILSFVDHENVEYVVFYNQIRYIIRVIRYDILQIARCDS